MLLGQEKAVAASNVYKKFPELWMHGSGDTIRKWTDRKTDKLITISRSRLRHSVIKHHITYFFNFHIKISL